jgi:hypothetical protein
LHLVRKTAERGGYHATQILVICLPVIAHWSPTQQVLLQGFQPSRTDLSSQAGGHGWELKRRRGWR